MGSITFKLLLRMLMVSAASAIAVLIVILTFNSSLKENTANNLLTELQYLTTSMLADKEESNLGALVGMAPEIARAMESYNPNALAELGSSVNRDYAARTPFKNIDLVVYDTDQIVKYRSFSSTPDPMVGKRAKRDFSELLSGRNVSETGLTITQNGLYVNATILVRTNRESGNILGIADLRSGIRSVVSELASKDVNYALVLNDTATNIWTGARDNQKVGDYYMANSSWFNDVSSWYEGAEVNKAIEQGFVDSGNKVISAIPVESNGRHIGYQLVGIDKTYPDLQEAISGINSFIMAMLTVCALTILTLVSMLWFNLSRVISRPLTTIQKRIEDAAQSGNLNTSFSAQSNDEIGKMSRALNTLFSSMSGAVAEVNSTVGALAAGDFSKRVKGSYTGDLQKMQDGINASADNITDIVEEITKTMSSLEAGNYDQEVNIVGEGAYKELMQNAQAAMGSTNEVISQINDLMDEVSRGYFSHRVEAEAAGELLRLKDNINNTLDGLEQAIGETAQVMIAQSTGDLTGRVKSNLTGTLSILKEGVNNSTGNISSMLSQSNYAVINLSEGTVQIARGIQDLAGRTQSQAASLQETAASMEEITAMIRQTADNAQEANTLSSTSKASAQQANDVVKDTIVAIQEINESSTKISEITALIDSIAFQTNLLALNAAVEAARAGDHGRGFAVVAGEVRTLAQRSADAAREIRVLIDDTVNKVRDGAEMASQSGEALVVINESIDNVTQIVEEISKATKEQATGVEQVNVAVAAIDTATQQNAALVDETAYQTEDMQRSAEEVMELTKTFNIDLDQIAFRTAMETGKFQFAHARRTHRQWKGTISAYVAGMDVDINMEAAVDHTKCALGQWYFGDGQEYAHIPEFREVDTYHAQLHQTIHKILEANKANDLDTQEKELDRLDELSAIVIDKLTVAEVAVARYEAAQGNGNGNRNGNSKPSPAIAAPAATAPKAQQAPAATARKLESPKPAAQEKSPEVDSGDDWAEF